MKIDHSILRLVSLLIAGLSVYLGYDLFIKGVTGEASLVLNSGTLSGQLINAAPGLFFVLSGVVITIVSLYRKIEEYRPMARVVMSKNSNKSSRVDDHMSDEKKVGRVTIRRSGGSGQNSEEGIATFEIEIEDGGNMDYLDIPAFLRRQAD